MDRESVERLRFDRRLQGRRDWVDQDAAQANFDALPDVSDNMTTAAELEAEEEAARAKAEAEAAADALRARRRAEKGTEPISPAEIFDDGLRTRLDFEPEAEFIRRMGAFRSWLVARPERRILVVAHWGVWYSLLDQKSMANCELVRCAEDALVERDRLKAPPP